MGKLKDKIRDWLDGTSLARAEAEAGLPMIKICGIHEADEILGSWEGRKYRYVVSVGDVFNPPPKNLQGKNRTILRLEIDDTWTPGNEGRGFSQAPTPDMVRKILDLADQIKAKPGPTLLHCLAGKSRSTAVAMVLLYRLYFKSEANGEKAAYQKLKELRRVADPNLSILHLADEYMGTKFKEATGQKDYFAGI